MLSSKFCWKGSPPTLRRWRRDSEAITLQLRTAHHRPRVGGGMTGKLRECAGAAHKRHNGGGGPSSAVRPYLRRGPPWPRNPPLPEGLLPEPPTTPLFRKLSHLC